MTLRDISADTGKTPPLAGQVRALLDTRRFGRPLRAYASVPSTNTLAADWAARGATEGSTVIADFQTAGRGRMGRTWLAAPGQNLLFSVVLRPRLLPGELNLITLAASVAVCEALDAAVSPLRSAVKWPNDILLEGRKCCGMLLESTSSGNGEPTVILGVGLNVNQRDFPPEVETRATSLLLETGRRIARAGLLTNVLRHMERRYDLLYTDPEDLLSLYRARLGGIGREATVTWSRSAEPVAGTILGITETGALRLRTDAGEKICHAGDVVRREA